MKNRNRRFGAVTVLALGLLMAGGCDSGLTDINNNPNAPESVPFTNLLLGGIWDVASPAAGDGVFGQWVQLYHAQNWAQLVAQPVYNDEDKYTPRPTIPDDLWTTMFYALTDLAQVKRLAEESGDDNVWAVAEIMSVAGQQILTDYFGDMPYSEALKLDEDISYPAYDPQSDIYPDMIARLTTAAGMINPAASTTWGDYDPVYEGDMAGWQMFANSLRLRLAMRMVNKAPGAAQSAFEAAWASPIFGSVDDQASVDWTGAYPAANPIYEGIIYAGRTGDFRMSNSLITRLQAFNDPRLPIYADPAVSDGQYRGLINGLLPTQYSPVKGASDFSWIGEKYLAPATPSNLLSYAEVSFLGAEAAELGWDVGTATADELYQQGITASMEDTGVAAADITTYLAQASVGLTTGTYQGVDAIHVQKWISLFLAGPEAYTDLRRYGWDWETDGGTTGTSLQLAQNAVITDFPARFFYPTTEALLNPDNFPGQVELIDPVWFMP